MRDCRLGLVFVCRVIKHITILLFHIFPFHPRIRSCVFFHFCSHMFQVSLLSAVTFSYYS